MKDTLLLNNVISCEELMNRWSVTESRLVKIISENKIKEYSVISTRINPHDNVKIEKSQKFLYIMVKYGQQGI